MFKVLIIDDEEPVRDAIKILGEWDKLGIEEIIEAAEGKTGIELVKDRRPDIVLVDMRMPEMNGIEFLKTAEKEYPDMFNIVISGFNDFEFTRQAIKSKVVDYLLKPVNKEELNNALLKAVENIKEKQKKQIDIISRNITLNMSLPTLKEKIFMSIIEGSFNKQANNTYLKMIDAEDKNKCFGTAILRILNLEEISSKQFNSDIDLLYFALINVINEVSCSGFKCFSFRNPKVERDIIIILSYEGSFNKEIRYLAYDVIKRMVQKIQELFKIKAVAGIGDIYSDAVMLGDSHKSAEAIMNSINLFDLKDVIYIEGCNKVTTESHSVINRAGMIKNALENNNINFVKTIINEYLNKIKESGYFSLRDVNRNLNDFIILMNDIGLEFGVPQNEILEGYKNSINLKSRTFEFSKFEDFETIIFSILDYSCEKIRYYMKSNENFNINVIKDFIDKNYFEEIKISNFTEKYYLSREYLMKLFKQEFGCGIHEYVQKIRMEKAKELLNDSKIKIQSISQMLGYSDTNYFSKAFKNYYSISPSDYRLNNLVQRKES